MGSLLHFTQGRQTKNKLAGVGGLGGNDNCCFREQRGRRDMSIVVNVKEGSMDDRSGWGFFYFYLSQLSSMSM